MLQKLQIQDKVLLKNGKKYTVSKIEKVKSDDKSGRTIYGIIFDYESFGAYTWYYESGNCLTYWANSHIKKELFEPKTIIDIIKD